MKIFTAILASLLVTASAHANDVYLCKKNGKTIYTENPKDFGDCRLLELKVMEPSPEELERQRLERQNREAQRRVEEREALEERKVRAQETAARAEERQAYAAEEQARYQRERLEAEEAEQRRADSIPPVILLPAYRARSRHSLDRPGMLDIHIGPDSHNKNPATPSNNAADGVPWLKAGPSEP